MPSPLGVQESRHDNGAQHSGDPDDLRGISASAVDHLPQASDDRPLGVQGPSTKRARIARSMTDADLFKATGLSDREEAEGRYAEDRSIRRPRRSRPSGLVL